MVRRVAMSRMTICAVMIGHQTTSPSQLPSAPWCSTKLRAACAAARSPSRVRAPSGKGRLLHRRLGGVGIAAVAPPLRDDQPLKLDYHRIELDRRRTRLGLVRKLLRFDHRPVL